MGATVIHGDVGSCIGESPIVEETNMMQLASVDGRKHKLNSTEFDGCCDPCPPGQCYGDAASGCACSAGNDDGCDVACQLPCCEPCPPGQCYISHLWGCHCSPSGTLCDDCRPPVPWL